uniref:Uncharacterized protein n=1 Tax=Callithrix jacchus TaxID=9483 RepID=A0A8I3ZZR0_CALJA
MHADKILACKQGIWPHQSTRRFFPVTSLSSLYLLHYFLTYGAARGRGQRGSEEGTGRCKLSVRSTPPAENAQWAESGTSQPGIRKSEPSCAGASQTGIRKSEPSCAGASQTGIRKSEPSCAGASQPGIRKSEPSCAGASQTGIRKSEPSCAGASQPGIRKSEPSCAGASQPGIRKSEPSCAGASQPGIRKSEPSCAGASQPGIRKSEPSCAGASQPGIRKPKTSCARAFAAEQSCLVADSSHNLAGSIGREPADLNLCAFKLVITMKLRHKNKKPGKSSKGHKKPAKENGKKATSKVPSAPHLVHSNDHANREAELKRKRVEEMREMQQAAWEQGRQKRRTIASDCQDVLRCQQEFEQKEEVLQELNMFPRLEDEATRKAYYEEFHKVMEYSDEILEVLDASVPLNGGGCLESTRQQEAGPYLEQE